MKKSRSVQTQYYAKMGTDSTCSSVRVNFCCVGVYLGGSRLSSYSDSMEEIIHLTCSVIVNQL